MDAAVAAITEVSGPDTDIPGDDPGLSDIYGHGIRSDGDQTLTEFEVEIMGGNECIQIDFIQDAGAAD